MRAPVIVPDASVLIKWSLDSTGEKDRVTALAIRNLWIAGRLRIILPSLWIYEVGNVLGMKQPRLAPELLEIYVGYQFEEERASELVKTIYDIMKTINATFYDAAYHSVAIKHAGTFVTADVKYARKASSLGHVTALKDWSI